MIEILTSLNKGAFLILNGAELLGFEGKDWYRCKLRIRTDKQLLNRARTGTVKYQAYMKLRAKLKTKIKKAYNIH